MSVLASGDPEPGRTGAFLALVPAAVYLVTAFYVGSLERDPLHGVSFHWKDKLLHALFFGVMQRTHYRAWEYLFPRKTAKELTIAACATATAAGILLELWQGLLPHRSAEVLDALADAVGAALFGWIFYVRAEKSSELEQAP